MHNNFVNRLVFRFVTIALFGIGLAQPAMSDVIGTQELLDAELRQAQLTRLELLLTRDDVAAELIAYGVAPDTAVERLQNLTTAELITLDGQVNRHVAGGSAVGIIGAVFLVLLILELVGVTDVFKAL